MASGPPFEGGVDGLLEKRRCAVSKVYTRKKFRKGGPKPYLNEIPRRPDETLPPPATHPLSSSQTFVTTADDVNSSLHQLRPPPPENHWPLVPHRQSSTASLEDACSLNHNPGANLPSEQNWYVSINLGSKTKHEARELHRRLNTEIELVRSLSRKIEARQLAFSLNDGCKSTPTAGHTISQPSAVDFTGPFPTRKDQGISVPSSRCQFSVVVPVGAGVDYAIGHSIEREKRTPKANQLYKNTDFLLGMEKLPPQQHHKKSKANVNKNATQSAQGKFYEQAFKKCGVLLSKLMKHNHGWVFNSPVDPDALGLPDYHRIIRHPMDLGTVESRLSSNWYKAPKEFAQDVRLTFHNALNYNPKGQDVYLMAEQLLQMFEERWPIIEADLAYLHSFPPLKALPPPDRSKTLERSDSTVHHSAANTKLKSLNQIAHIGRSPALKKPKAKDPDKRDMTYDEKQRLSSSLQKLPLEKLDIVVQIIRKRSFSFNQHEDEIEIDIDCVDIETLWELDRFLTNYKKSLSKIKRKEALAILARAETEPYNEDKVSDAAPLGLENGNQTVSTAKVNDSLSVGGAKIGEIRSRPSSSSSSSSDSGSTSTDSDSGSSSGY